VSERVQVSVNGERREIEMRAEESAVEVLRDRLGLTGAKLGCGEGVCGACTVLLDGVAVTSCLLPATALEGRVVTTVEGFGPDLHPVQRAFIARDALQVHVSTQAARQVAHEIAEGFGLADEAVHLVADHVGGGFGAKQKLTPETAAAIELARAAGAPVRVVLERGRR
jgi:aerobic-type carbon monoxide dehydrogenase small subunit (CoxS/CutS family)